MRRILAVLMICLLAVSPLVFTWTGSEATIEIVSPNGTTDTDSLYLPVNVKVKQFNNEQGIDYAVYYMVEDTNSDSSISTAEWNAKTEIGRIPDVNVERAFSIGSFGAAYMTVGTYYFIVGVGVDLHGDASCDTTLMNGETYNGGGSSGAANVAIARFRAGGLRP